MGPALAVLPAVSGLLAASVAYGRWRVAPLAARRPAARRAEARFTTSH
jgi:hypothetical protein